MEELLKNRNVPIEDLLALWAAETNRQHEEELRRRMAEAEQARRREQETEASHPQRPTSAAQPHPGLVSELWGWLTD